MAGSPKSEEAEPESASFWEQTHEDAAGSRGGGGYLTHEYPSALARHRFDAEWRLVQRWLRAYPHGSGACLDVGCADGTWLRSLAPRYERSCGIDVAEHAVAYVSETLVPEHGGSLTAHHAGLLDFDPPARFDLIFVGGVLMYIEDEDLEAAVEKLRGWLAPGGLLILRETVHRRETWYRDAPLSPGLFADPDAPRGPYRAIYRPRRLIGEHLSRGGLELLATRDNVAYKLSDMTETQLLLVDRLLGGALGKDRARAERWAERIHAWRWLTLYPLYFAKRLLSSRPWKLENAWFVCRRPAGEEDERANKAFRDGTPRVGSFRLRNGRPANTG